MTLFLEHYKSNPDDDRLNAEAMLKVITSVIKMQKRT